MHRPSLELSYTVFRPFAKKVREYLGEVQSRGGFITWDEDDGFATRTFKINGDTRILKKIRNDLDSWCIL